MAAMKSGVRVGAAAFALGLSLAGPQALGVAFADAPDADSASVSEAGAAGSAPPSRRAARTGRQGASSTPRAAAPRAAAKAGGSGGSPASALRGKGALQQDVPLAQTAGLDQPAPSPAATAQVVDSSVSSSVVADNQDTFPVVEASPGTADARGGAVRPSRRPVAGVTPLPATDFMTALNGAVAQWFDDTASFFGGLPASPVSEFLQGALLMVRRDLFNQTASVDPANYLIRATGQTVGNVGATDAEGDALTYTLVQQPSYGTVEVAADGTYTYTPGSGFSGYDAFKIAVGDTGFNLLDPLAIRSTEAFVEVPYWSRGGADPGFDYYNFTGQDLVVGRIISGKIENGPDTGLIVQPGDHIHFDIPEGQVVQVPIVAAGQSGDSSANSWTLQMTEDTQHAFYKDYIATCASGSCVWWGNDYTVLIKDAPGSPANDFTADPRGEKVLSSLLAASKALGGPLTFSYPNPTATFIAANPSEYKPVGVSHFNSGPSETFKLPSSVTQTTETINTSDWQVSAEVGITIKGLVEATVAKTWGGSSTTTESISYSLGKELGVLPYSYVTLLGAVAKMGVTGDVVATFGDKATDPVAFRFKNFDYIFPDVKDSQLSFNRYDYPYQPLLADGTRDDKVGFILRDKASSDINPTYTEGSTHQLNVQAFVGAMVAPPVDYTTKSKYTSSDPKVATVDESGKLTALSAGVTQIEASDSWTAPDGMTGVVTSTITVTVERPWWKPF